MPFTRRKLMQSIAVALAAGMLPRTAQAHFEKILGQWNQFMGPARNGVALSDGRGLNLDWEKKTPQVLWKVPLGEGFASIACYGDQLFTAAEREQKQFVFCVDQKTGREVWAREFAAHFKDSQGFGAGPRATPTIDPGGKVLFAFAPTGDLCCLRLDDGAVVWSVNVNQVCSIPDRSDETFYWGLSSSPLVHGDQVIVQPGGTAGNSLVAFNKSTGQRVWGAGDDGPGYGSPIVVNVFDQELIVCTTARSIIAARATSGELLWRYEFGNEFNCNCATPVWSQEAKVLFVSAAYDTGAAALDLLLEDSGEIRVGERWRNQQMQNQFATSIVSGQYVYGIHGTHAGHNLRCLDLLTGKMQWANRSVGRGTLIQVGDHLLCWSEDGTLRLIEVNPEKFVQKGEVTGLLEPKAWAPPAYLNGRLYLRDEKNMLCLDLE